MEIVGTRGQILMAKYPLPIPYTLGAYICVCYYVVLLM